uniref:Uncharacterized protein n=1 Tax=Anopheles atroparvus TaxID=41427 RepID=A0AAG5DEF8_ANOAO
MRTLKVLPPAISEKAVFISSNPAAAAVGGGSSSSEGRSSLQQATAVAPHRFVDPIDVTLF